jgi:hypothetical protein
MNMRSYLLRLSGLIFLLGFGVSLGSDEAVSASALNLPPLDAAHPIIGTLESDPARIAATNAAGARAVVVGH